MNYLNHLVRNHPVSCFYIVMIWVLCFATIPPTPLDNVSLIDKWVHIAMYGGTCGTIWLEYLRRHDTGRLSPKVVDIRTGIGSKPPVSPRRLMLLAWLAPIAMSGLIEILQATCTGGRRSGDWLDFAANSIGATLAAVCGTIVLRLKYRNNLRR